MTTGLQVFNEGFTYQIDETNRNFQLTNATNGTTSNLYDDGFYAYYWYDFVITNAVNPMLGVYCANRPVNVTAITKSGATWTFRIVSGFNDAAIDLYTFDVSTVSPVNYGLQIFNAAADLVYHSGNKPLRIVDVITSALSSYTHTYTSGRKYAVVYLYPGFEQNGEQVDKAEKREYTFYAGSINTSTHVIDFITSNIQLSDITTYTYDPVINFGPDAATALVVDVTNF